ncbi:terminase family protein [Aurantimonas sp. A2-1-M11]|uniref:terminase large subunit domain-containing protein n=1 Tax=Aurantimonas sp. A2-1-M11 TaxID=3113712 RepID=UPI002F938487
MAPLTETEFWGELDALTQVYPGPVLAGASPVWASLARPAPLPPPGDWRQWLLIGGRGSGKTRAGAEWVRAMAAGAWPIARRPHGRIALIAETLGDAREVMIAGESGIVAASVGPRPVYEVSRRRLVFPNGAIAQLFSSDDPEALRGDQFDAAWGDEFPKWVHGEACFGNLQFGLRLGTRPRALFTTTPRPIPLLKRLIAEAGTVTTHMPTAENATKSGAGIPGGDGGALWRVAPRPAGAGRADAGGARGRAVRRGGDRRGAGAGGAGTAPGVRGGGSAGDGDGALGGLRHHRGGQGGGPSRPRSAR